MTNIANRIIGLIQVIVGILWVIAAPYPIYKVMAALLVVVGVLNFITTFREE